MPHTHTYTLDFVIHVEVASYGLGAWRANQEMLRCDQPPSFDGAECLAGWRREVEKRVGRLETGGREKGVGGEATRVRPCSTTDLCAHTRSKQTQLRPRRHVRRMDPH